MELTNRLEGSVPVWTTKICRRAKTRNRIVVGTCIIDHGICRIVRFDLGSKILIEYPLAKHLGLGGRLTLRISIWLSISCDSIAMSNDLNHSNEPKSLHTQKK